MRLLIVDNYDSFTWNLIHLIEKCSSISFEVKQNNQFTLEEVADYDKILLSPGPGVPSKAGLMPALLKAYHDKKSILGVCLGLQAIAECFNSPLRNLETVCHGIATPIILKNTDPLFKDCPASFQGGRYHSWVIDEKQISSDLIVTAIDSNGQIMAAKHKQFDVRGVQFHPESILSEHGETIIGNWLSMKPQ